MNLIYVYPYASADRDQLFSHLLADWRVSKRRNLQPDDDLAGQLAEADAMVAMRVPPDLPPAPNLKLLQLPGAGFDFISVASLPADCAVCNVFEHEIAMGEYVLGVMLSMTLRLGPMDAELRRGDWSSSLMHGGRIHGELHGKTLGLVGFGHIGRQVARLAGAFGMHSICVTRSPEKIEADGALRWAEGMDHLERLLGEADYVVLACPLTDATRDLIDAGALAKMKATAYLINVARAGVVDEQALFDACASRAIAGAAIDVWYRYPQQAGEILTPSRLPFETLDNVILSPHTSCWTDQLWLRRIKVIAENLNRLMRGEPLLNRIQRTDLEQVQA